MEASTSGCENFSLDWESIKLCSNNHIYNCAKHLLGFLSEFKEVSKCYQQLLSEKKVSDEKYNLLCEQSKRDDCDNCAALQKQLHRQINKFNTIADLFKEITSEPSSCSENTQICLEKARNIFTQTDNQIRPVEKKPRESVNDTNNSNSPNKKIKYDKRMEISPILKKGKSNKLFRNPSPGVKTPKKNLNVEYSSVDLLTPPGKENHLLKDDDVIECSPSNDLTNKIIKKEHDSTPVRHTKEKPRNSLSLLRNSPIHNIHSNEKKYKQARLALSKCKPKVSLDVTRSDSFCGGVRGTLDDEQMMKSPDVDNSKVIDRSDVIEESPSYNNKPTKNNFKLLGKTVIKTNERHGNNNNKCVKDEDTTFVSFDNEATCLPVELNKSILPKEINKNHEVKPLAEVIYKEDPIRKKAEKDKLPGWSCKKCNDFYNVAFKGNDELIRKKIQECSKHRGKFNPERRNTPPGFWDVDMLPTQDTEAFNKQNNAD